MAWMGKLKNFLNQNIPARVFLYMAALFVPAVEYFHWNKEIYVAFFEKLLFWDIMWIGFYSCFLLFWACNKRWYERIINILLAALNITIFLPVCLGSMMISTFAPLGIIGMAIFPFLPDFMAFVAVCILPVVLLFYMFRKID